MFFRTSAVVALGLALTAAATDCPDCPSTDLAGNALVAQSGGTLGTPRFCGYSPDASGASGPSVDCFYNVRICLSSESLDATVMAQALALGQPARPPRQLKMFANLRTKVKESCLPASEITSPSPITATSRRVPELKLELRRRAAPVPVVEGNAGDPEDDWAAEPDDETAEADLENDDGRAEEVLEDDDASPLALALVGEEAPEDALSPGMHWMLPQAVQLLISYRIRSAMVQTYTESGKERIHVRTVQPKHKSLLPRSCTLVPAKDRRRIGVQLSLGP
ncbi:hypothetical protein B0H12DRAFT_1239068 [Mycena haematopus]|nr:hypothetical protein B0H12DRAFT_1239068 [Mycena haematopus]